MKKLFFIFVYFFLFVSLFSNDIFIIEGGKIYKVELNENGDTLSKEEIEIIPLDSTKQKFPLQQLKEDIKEEPTKIDTPLYNLQILRIIPLKWQIGWTGACQGLGYGLAITSGLGIAGEKYSPIINSSVPILMFFLPPILIKDEIPEAAYPIVDWGYRIGPVDYFVLRHIISLDLGNYSERNFLYAALAGYTESWGGYILVRKTGTYRRAASDFYGAGSFLGYLWGGLIGSYIVWEFFDTTGTNNDRIDKAALGTTFAFSAGMRSLGFYLGNREDLKMKSFDSYIYAFNTIPGLLLATDVYFNYLNVAKYEKIYPLSAAILSMGTTALSAFVLKNIHLDDENAVLMMIGGLVVGALGQSIERVIASYTGDENIHPSIAAFCMIAGELGVYYLRKDAIKNNLHLGSNLRFNIYPTNNNGLGTMFSYSF